MSMRKVFGSAAIAALFSVLIAGPAAAQRSNYPKSHDKLALSEKEITELLLLMDTDKNGKISKQEFMRFMEAEFDRLDKNKNGELDPKELRQSRLRATPPPYVGK